MPEKTERMFFEGRGKEVALVRIDKDGNRTVLLMPTVAVLSMPKIVREMIHKILAQRAQQPAAQPGTLPKPCFPVEKVWLNVEPQTHEILLEITDTYGNESGFALPLVTAKALAERLPVRIAEAEAAANRQKKQ